MNRTYIRLKKAHPELDVDLQRMMADDVKWILERQTHMCPTCLKTLQMSDIAWDDHFGLHNRINELGDMLPDQPDPRESGIILEADGMPV